MSWTIFKKTIDKSIRTKCEICNNSFQNDDKIFQTKGYGNQKLYRFHAKCLIKKLQDNTLKEVLED